MRAALLWRALLVVLLSAPCAALAEEYWAYRYQDVDVMASGTDAYAINLARNCVRLDAILARLLGIRTNQRIPTHIYSLSRSTMRRITGEDWDSYYHVSGYYTTVVTDSGANLSARVYTGGYYGYVAGLLAAGEVLRGPNWYMVGLPSVFSEAVFEGNKIKLGFVSASNAYTLTHAALIPLRTFLSMTQQDAQAGGERGLQMYSAESWYLARLVFVEGKHRAEFDKYFELMRAGHPEAEAFTSSFRISYEDLDLEITREMHERAHVYLMDVPPDVGAASAVALRLSPAEADASLAFLAMDFKHGADPVQLARQALQADPRNETALRVLALGLYEKESYAQALDAVNRLSALQRSQAAYADCADVLAGLSRSGGGAHLPVDPSTLLQRARDDYAQALAMDANDNRSRAGLAQLEQLH